MVVDGYWNAQSSSDSKFTESEVNSVISNFDREPDFLEDKKPPHFFLNSEDGDDCDREEDFCIEYPRINDKFKKKDKKDKRRFPGLYDVEEEENTPKPKSN